MKRVHNQMKRAHNRMKRAHKDDRGTNLIWAKCSIGAPYTGLKFSHIFDAFNSFGLIDFVLFVLILHIFLSKKLDTKQFNCNFSGEKCCNFGYKTLY